MAHAGNRRARDARVVLQQPPCPHEDAANLAVLDEDFVDVTEFFPIGPEHVGSLADQNVVATQVGDVLRGDGADDLRSCSWITVGSSATFALSMPSTKPEPSVAVTRSAGTIFSSARMPLPRMKPSTR